MPELLFAAAFTLWGSPTTWLEIVAFVLALATVACNIRENHWGWPLAMISSALYALLFWRSKLYGDASLQVFFVIVSFWGWWQWLGLGRPAGQTGAARLALDPARLRVRRLDARQRVQVVLVCALLWPAMGAFLKHFTDTDVPWWDAFPTALSVLGQILLGRKIIENWVLWWFVNAASVGLFAFKGLWLTCLLYTLFLGMAVAGWRTWQARMHAASDRP